MSLVRWNPIGNLSWPSTFGGVFDEFFAPLARGNGRGAAGFSPALEVTENEDAYHVRLELPGVSRKEIKVSLEDEVLTIRGERREEERSEGESVHIAERRYGAFQRSIRLPESADLSAASAEHKDGVLQVVLPKKEEAKPVRRELPVK